MGFEVRRGGAEDDESVEVMVVRVRVTTPIWQAHRRHVVESALFRRSESIPHDT